jgi:hypothetical protein
MAKANSPHKIIVVLKLPNTVAAFIIRATAIHDAMAANSKTYPSPPLVLTTYATHISALSAAETLAKTRAAGAVAARITAQKQVSTDIGELQGYVQSVVNADPTDADSLAQQAGMFVHAYTHPAKPPLAVKQTLTGVVHVVAKAIKGAKTNDWQYSVDGGKTWLSVPSTTSANTTITGLTPGVLVSYRQRPITKAGPQDWSQPISAMVT